MKRDIIFEVNRAVNINILVVCCVIPYSWLDKNFSEEPAGFIL